MTPSIKLSGNLGERHRSFNALVHEAYLQKTPLQFKNTPQAAAIDRLFKIDLASKQKNVEDIITTLKDDDMLYVSRALKSQWLLDSEYSEIINPGFLENDLFPHMTLTAVNKMRHWLQINLRDPHRCNEFYQFYKDRNFNIAAKFLWHCSNECILGEISGILDKITPKRLKRLSEKVPLATKIYYDNLKQNQKLLKYYLKKDSKFFKNTKYILKSDPDIFFYILENFFVNKKFNILSCDITKYIMKNHRNQFLMKPELYAAWFLDMKALSKCLNSEEIKDLVLKLARAEYLKEWFSYQNVELLIKRLSNDEKSAFKKLVFVAKDFGTTVKEWPYPTPTPPELKSPQTSLFDDHDVDNNVFKCGNYFPMGAMGAHCGIPRALRSRIIPIPTQTLLDQLFDKYRFSNFKQTYNELRNRLKTESSPQNRQFMLLVLVSKTGGRTEDLITLLDLLSQYKNEPVHIRAAIVRSLVKRACVWRLPTEHWSRLLEWGHGLGLDGSNPEAACREGLHAVVIRNLLANDKPSAAVSKMFLTDFVSLKEYSLTVDEYNCICTRLPALLLNDALSDQEEPNLSLLQLLLDTLKAYNLRFDYFPGTVDAIASAAKYYWNADDDTLRRDTEYLLRQLYNAGVGRKRFIKEYFEINQTDASYVNALRHDISILENIGKLEKLVEGRDLKHEAFFRKVAVYFMEEDGLGERYRAFLEHWAVTEPEKTARPKNYHSHHLFSLKPLPAVSRRQTLARPLAILSSLKFQSLLESFDEAPPKTGKRRMASALRANAHLVRPAFDLQSFGWRKIGAKAIANCVTTCRQRDVEGYLSESLSWKQTLRIALVLAKRVGKERDVFEVFASKRPGVAFRAALKYFCREGDNSDISVWEMVKSRISEGDGRQLCSYMKMRAKVPVAIKPEYCFLLFLACIKRARHMEWQALSMIPAVIADLDDKYIFDAYNDFLDDYFPLEAVDKKNIYYMNRGANIRFCIRIIARFLVLSTTEEMMEKRLHEVGIPFLNRLELSLNKNLPADLSYISLLDSFLSDLRYNKAYFDAKYVSILPVFQRITEWMHGRLPVEKWFDKYVILNLTMLYYKTARICIEQMPELFTDDSTKLKGAKMLGAIFGKLICNEIEELNQNYFPSIIEIYAIDFIAYFRENFCSSFDDSVENFTTAVLNELIANKSAASRLLAKFIFQEFGYRLKPEVIDDISNKFKMTEVKELCFVLQVE